MAAAIALAGYRVVLYDRFEEIIAPVLKKGGIELSGVSVRGFARFEKVTNNLREALSEKGLILIVLPAFAHAYIAEQIAPLLEKNDKVILSPGSTGGAFEFRKIITEHGAPKGVMVGETDNLIYTCQITSPGNVKIMGVKDYLGLAAFPSKDTQVLIEPMKKLYSQAYAEKNVLFTGLNNMNPIFHVFPMLANLGWMEATQGKFRFYYDGITSSVARLIEAVDRERIKLCHSYEVQTISAMEWQKQLYGAKGHTLPQILHSNRSYREILAPRSKDDRFITQDVPMGLVPMAEIAKLADIPTPFMDSAILIASEIMEEEYRVTGRNLDAMGLAGLSKKELLCKL